MYFSPCEKEFNWAVTWIRNYLKNKCCWHMFERETYFQATVNEVPCNAATRDAHFLSLAIFARKSGKNSIL